MKKNQPTLRCRQTGLSLIELMVALLISLLVSIGILQIFSASRATYQMQDGLSRVQESGRYAIQYLQRQMRMVGYMGCGADTERTTQASFVNHLATYSATVPGGDAVDPLYRFQRPIEAFSADALPSDLTALNLRAVAGTDVLVLRTVSEESVPVISIARTAGNLGLNVAVVAADVSTVFGAQVNGNPVVYALQNCRSADVFVGTLNTATVSAIGNAAPNVYLDPTVTDCNPTGNCPWDFRISNVFLNASHGGPAPTEPQLNAELHRAEYTVLYVRPNPNNIPSLYMLRFKRDSASDLDDPQELAEGIENLQARFGVDTTGDGQVDSYKSAADVNSGSTGAALDERWRNVLSVRVGLVVRSPERAGVSAVDGAGDPRTLTLLGTLITPLDDGMMRQVYETTISLRNRLFNS